MKGEVLLLAHTPTPISHSAILYSNYANDSSAWSEILGNVTCYARHRTAYEFEKLGIECQQRYVVTFVNHKVQTNLLGFDLGWFRRVRISTHRLLKCPC
jgi:hypothetical protein